MLMMTQMAPLVGFEQGGGGPNIANLFATTLYTGNNGGSTRTFTTGVNIRDNGGLIWQKARGGAESHSLHDTARGMTEFGSSSPLSTNTTSAAGASSSVHGSANGVVIYDNVVGLYNNSGVTYALWSFARAARFFDVVTWTGNGTAGRTIAHGLGTTPGFIVVKRTDSSGAWVAWHRSAGGNNYLFLNATDAAVTDGGTYWGNGSYTAPTSSAFTVSGASAVNASGGTYVAYIFAHDAATDGVIQCANYTGNGSSTGPTITLGWQPQWLMIKRQDVANDWWIYDSVRSGANPRVLKLLANSSAAEDTSGEDVDFNATGFQPKSAATGINEALSAYYYVAIRAAA